MDDFAPGFDAKGVRAIDIGLGLIFATHRFDDGFKNFLHVLGLANFVLALFKVKAQHGNPPRINQVRINFAVGVGIRNHLAASGKCDVGTVTLAAGALQMDAVAFNFITQIIEHSGAGHFAAAAYFNVIAAWKIIFAFVFPPGNVHVHAAGSVVVVWRHLGHFWDVAPAFASNRIGEVAADLAGRVGKPVRKKLGLGIEKKPRGFARACGNDHGACVHTLFRACNFIDVRNTSGISSGADENFARHRPGNQGEPASLHRGRNEHLAGTEVGSGDATAAALATVVAGRTAVEWLGKNGQARGNAGDIEFIAGLFNEDFVAARFRRRKKDAVGGAGHIFLGAEDADVAYYLVVEGRKILVGDGPVLAQAIARFGFEIDRSEPQSNAAPVIGTSADDARAEPLKIGARSRGVRFAGNFPRTVGSKEFPEIGRGSSANADATMRKIVGPHEHFEVLI